MVVVNSEDLMGYFQTSFSTFNHRDDEWAAYEPISGGRKPLWEGKLWLGVKTALDNLKIENEEGEFSYRSNEGPALEYLKAGNFPSDWREGDWSAVILPTKGQQQEYERLLEQHPIITLPFKTYKTTFSLGSKPWENPLVRAASHRILKCWPDSSNFEKRVENDVRGLLAELFICKLFNYPENEFWQDFCSYLGRGDDGWDIKVKPNGDKGNSYLVDSKTWIRDRPNHNIGGLKNHDLYKPKVRDLIIAPVEAEWLNTSTIHLSLSYLIDAESYWDFSEYIMEPEYRLKIGDFGNKSRYCKASEFYDSPAMNKGQDIYNTWGLPLRIPRPPKPREAGRWIKEKLSDKNSTVEW